MKQLVHQVLLACTLVAVSLCLAGCAGDQESPLTEEEKTNQPVPAEADAEDEQ